MVYAKCTEKFRDNTDKITGYMVVDNYGHGKRFKSEDLKGFIRNGKLCITNLTLTSDNRLIDTSDKRYLRKKIGSTPADEMHMKSRTRLMAKNNAYRMRMANAIVCMNMKCADYANSLKSLTDTICATAGICTDYTNCNDSTLVRYQTKAFLKLMDTDKDYVKDFLYSRLTHNFSGFRRVIDWYLATKDLRGAEMIVGSLRLIKEYLEGDFGESEYDRGSLTAKISDFLIENEDRVKLERALG